MENSIDERGRCALILEQLETTRTLTEKENQVFVIMVGLNEKNFSSLNAEQMMVKHQKALNYILSQDSN